MQRACWGATPRHAETVRVMLDFGAKLDGPAACRTRNKKTIDVLRARFPDDSAWHGEEL